MKKFLTKLFWFAMVGFVPFLLIVWSYFYFDPFMVLRKYTNYSNSNVALNRDFVSTETFINKYRLYHYNSFILGSSRTMAYRPGVWKTYLQPGASVYAFDAFSETLFGIYTKLRYLDEINNPISNALIIVCRDQTFVQFDNSRGHMFMKDPAVTHESKFAFQLSSFKSYTNPSFLFDYFYFKITGKFKPFMWGNMEETGIPYDAQTNATGEVNLKEQEISKDSVAYYKKMQHVFYARHGERVDTVPRINAQGVIMFKKIAAILKKHNTNYKVVLGPLYEQMKYAKPDIDFLKKLFGNRLYDFSGKNAITDNEYNYYEDSHYRQKVGTLIMKDIYSK